jgi:hypothetical protein
MQLSGSGEKKKSIYSSLKLKLFLYTYTFFFIVPVYIFNISIAIISIPCIDERKKNYARKCSRYAGASGCHSLFRNAVKCSHNIVKACPPPKKGGVPLTLLITFTPATYPIKPAVLKFPTSRR